MDIRHIQDTIENLKSLIVKTPVDDSILYNALEYDNAVEVSRIARVAIQGYSDLIDIMRKQKLHKDYENRLAQITEMCDLGMISPESAITKLNNISAEYKGDYDSGLIASVKGYEPLNGKIENLLKNFKRAIQLELEKRQKELIANLTVEDLKNSPTLNDIPENIQEDVKKLDGMILETVRVAIDKKLYDDDYETSHADGRRTFHIDMDLPPEEIPAAIDKIKRLISGKSGGDTPTE